MNLAKKGQFHFSVFKVDSQNPKFYLEYLLIILKNQQLSLKMERVKTYWAIQKNCTGKNSLIFHGIVTDFG